jgi:hypothetical protein
MPINFDNYAPYRPYVDAGQFSYSIEGALQLLEMTKEIAAAQFQTAQGHTFLRDGVRSIRFARLSNSESVL